jgi:hypothetical protein
MLTTVNAYTFKVFLMIVPVISAPVPGALAGLEFGPV